MKKIVLTIVALATLSMGSAMAGNNLLGLFNIGGRLGIVSSSEVIPTTGGGLKDAINAEGTGWTGTVFARINIPKLPLYIQPELQYTNTKINIPSLDSIVGGDDSAEESYKYVELPLLIGAEFGLGSLVSVRINAGPVFPLTTGRGMFDLKKEDFEQAWDNLTTDPHMTWTAGLGVKVLSLIAEIRYNGNFNGDSAQVDGVSVNTERTSWNLSVGVMF